MLYSLVLRLTLKMIAYYKILQGLRSDDGPFYKLQATIAPQQAEVGYVQKVYIHVKQAPHVVYRCLIAHKPGATEFSSAQAPSVSHEIGILFWGT